MQPQRPFGLGWIGPIAEGPAGKAVLHRATDLFLDTIDLLGVGGGDGETETVALGIVDDRDRPPVAVVSAARRQPGAGGGPGAVRFQPYLAATSSMSRSSALTATACVPSARRWAPCQGVRSDIQGYVMLAPEREEAKAGHRPHPYPASRQQTQPAGVGRSPPCRRQRQKIGIVDRPTDAPRRDLVHQVERRLRERRFPIDEEHRDRPTDLPDTPWPEGATEDREGGQAGDIRQLAREPVVERRLQHEVVQQQQPDRQQEQRRAQQIEALH